MADKKFLYDAHGAVIRSMHVHETVDNTESFTTVLHENVDGLLDCVREMRDRDVNRRKSHWRVASFFPEAFLDKSMREGWVNDSKAWARLHNDPDNAAFRVFDGRISGTEGGR